MRFLSLFALPTINASIGELSVVTSDDLMSAQSIETARIFGKAPGQVRRSICPRHSTSQYCAKSWGFLSKRTRTIKDVCVTITSKKWVKDASFGQALRMLGPRVPQGMSMHKVVYSLDDRVDQLAEADKAFLKEFCPSVFRAHFELM
jgi:hypothetical protein